MTCGNVGEDRVARQIGRCWSIGRGGIVKCLLSSAPGGVVYAGGFTNVALRLVRRKVEAGLRMMLFSFFVRVGECISYSHEAIRPRGAVGIAQKS
jgi:hypothetical protein